MSRTFSPTDAAVEGFRIIRRRPDILLVWGVLVLLAVAGALGVVGSVLAPDVAHLVNALESHGTPDALRPAAEKVRGTQLLLTPLTAALHAVLGTAVLRAVLRPDSRSIGYLGLGADEFRVFLVQMVSGLLIGSVLVAFVLFVMVFTAIGIAAAGLHSADIGRAVLDAVVIGGLMGGLGTGYVAIRLSLAAPMTFEAGAFRMFESWSQTRGQVWRLTGAYVLAGFLNMVVFLALLVAGLIVGGGVFIAEGGLAVLADPGSGSALLSVIWPAVLVGMVPVALASVMQTLVLQAPAARAFRSLSLSQD